MFFTMLNRSRGLVAAIALAGGLVASSLPASASSVVNLKSPAKSAIGWQPIQSISIAQGQPFQFVSYNCPTGLVADSGSYAFNTAGQDNPPLVGFLGTRLDLGSFVQWSWEFAFPNGAPAGTQVLVDVHCVAK